MHEPPTITLALPLDSEAERRLVGIALTSQRGAELAAGRVGLADFYDPRLARLFVAATNPANAKRATTDRVIAASAATGEHVASVQALEQLDRLSLTDESGAYSRRVAVAAQRRRAFIDAVGTFEVAS